uniref:Uncharacterized protein n=1 Tax=Anguilla anguilla TaxID=7936 RepID=A0A0E9WTD8_ANGAN
MCYLSSTYIRTYTHYVPYNSFHQKSTKVFKNKK